MGEVEISALTVDGREIPYEFRVDQQVDDEGEWYDVQLGAFGYSVAGAIQWGLGRVDFASVDEREAAVLLAIEATLAWLPGGRGVERGDGYNRSTFNGVQYRLSDFGPYFEKVDAGD
jgi:chorismate synthase